MAGILGRQQNSMLATKILLIVPQALRLLSVTMAVPLRPDFQAALELSQHLPL